MPEPKTTITVYSNGGTYEIDPRLLYDPFPPKSEEPRVENKAYNEKENTK